MALKVDRPSTFVYNVRMTRDDATTETKSAGKTVNWIVNGKAYETAREPGLCPKCGALDTVTALPAPLLSVQIDGTTHVCHPSLGGCNHGFARTVTPLKYSPAARELAAYHVDIYKAKRNARVAKKGGIR